jgi:acyl-coenzyme A synthetase/AMP-(fatty) acid ligase
MIEVVVSALSAVGAVGLVLASWLFARSLLPGATPLVARFALAEDPETAVQPIAQRYLRWLTLAWTAALLASASIVASRAAGEAVLPPAIGYLTPLALAVLLFFGERIVRRLMFGTQSVGPVSRQWRIATGVMREELKHLRPGTLNRAEPVFQWPDQRRTLIVWRDGECSVEALQSAAIRLSTSLPPGGRVLVDCEDRAVFLWAVLAVWAARCTVVMPLPELKHEQGNSHRAHCDCIVTDRLESENLTELPMLRVDSSALRDALKARTELAATIALPMSHIAAVFFTSGSTGRPTAQAKTWRQLVDAAEAMGELLQVSGAAPLLGGTVVHSHMFGFELLVMQALRGSARVYAPRIVYPNDLAMFAALVAPQKWLVTTPYHLELFVEAGPLPRDLQRVISATMPLGTSLAATVEAGTGAQVHEIYGSTEAGCIATRRPVASQVWRLATDLRLALQDNGAVVLNGRRVGGALELRDRIVLTGEGFELCGRDTDLVKIAGRRTSLQALTAVLRAIHGVVDGAFIDGAAIGHKRLAAIVVAPGLSSEQIREALAARIEAAFLPRHLLLVDRLQRDDNGKIHLDGLVDSARAARRKGAPLLPEVQPSDVG